MSTHANRVRDVLRAVYRLKDISWGTRPAQKGINGWVLLGTVNVQNNLCPAQSCPSLTDRLTGWTLDLHCGLPCLQSCLWPFLLPFLTAWTPDMTHFLTVPGTDGGTCRCDQPGRAQIPQDCALVRVFTALPVLWSLSTPASSPLCASPVVKDFCCQRLWKTQM